MEQVAGHVEEHAVRLASRIDSPAFDSGFEFAAAGAELDGEFRCTHCGYGAVVHRALPPCPMCGGTVWENLSPLTRRFDD